MDFGHFGDSGSGGNPPPTPTSNQPENGTNCGNQDRGEQVFMHNMEHSGITCDVCNLAVRGFRYKCMECMDFDLCSACERKGNHPGHVMMRIAFPEQARNAIRRFVLNGHHGAGSSPLFGMFGAGFPFEQGHHRGFRRCHRGNHHAKESDGESGADDQRNDADCPYGMGRKGMKKWAKCMKKMAHQHRRSAETYARSCAQAAAQAAGVGIGTDESGNPTGGQIDFTAAAAQIQEFLNALGIPIDVVELYDSNFGNAKKNTDETAGTSRQAAPTPTAEGTAEQGSQQPSASSEQQQGGLAADMQQLHLSPTNAVATSFPVEGSAAAETVQPMTIDLESESAGGWTILGNGVGSDANRNHGEHSGTAATAPVYMSQNGPFSLPIQAETTIPIIPLATTQISPAQAPQAHPTSSVNGRLYPLNQPHLQQILNGVSQAMNSVVRNIPIVTNPGGPSVERTNGGPPSGVVQEMDVKCTTTLTQLLAMGFSNHDGWLSRLVIAKNGDLEAVLNALFPTGTQ